MAACVLTRTATARSRPACTGRRRGRRAGCRSPAPSRSARPRRRLKALVGPGHRAGLGGVEEAEQREGDQLARAKPAGMTSQSTSQKATTSSQTIAAGSAWSRWRAVTRAGPPADARSAPSSDRAARAVAERGCSSGEHEPGEQRAGSARRRSATGRCRSRARSQCAGWASRKRQPGRRPAPASGGCSAGSDRLRRRSRRLRRGSGRSKRTRSPPRSPPRSTRRSAARRPRSGRCASPAMPALQRPRQRPRRAATAAR